MKTTSDEFKKISTLYNEMYAICHDIIFMQSGSTLNDPEHQWKLACERPVKLMNSGLPPYLKKWIMSFCKLTYEQVYFPAAPYMSANIKNYQLTKKELDQTFKPLWDSLKFMITIDEALPSADFETKADLMTSKAEDTSKTLKQTLKNPNLIHFAIQLQIDYLEYTEQLENEKSQGVQAELELA